MGFIINSDTNEIITPLIVSRESKECINIKSKHVTQTHNLNASKYLMFFDIEPDDCLVQSETGQHNMFIPNIREFSCILITYHDFIHNKIDFKKLEYHEYTTISNHRDTIYDFVNLYKKYNYPVIVSHNGHNFDFILIMAHIRRYLTAENQKIIQKLKFYDTFLSVRYKKKEKKLGSLSNSGLFMNLNQYTEYSDLVRYAHTSLADCKMLMCWFQVFLKNI